MQTPMLMGARVYLPSIGRFTSTDPIPGGNVNAYAYPLDPINGSDITGMSAWNDLGSGCITTCAAGASVVQPQAPPSVLTEPHATISAWSNWSYTYTLRLAQSSGAAKSSHTQQRPYTGTPLYPVPEAAMVGSLPITAMGSSYKPQQPENFDLYNAFGSAADDYGIGQLAGPVVGCAIGAVFFGIGCLVGAASGIEAGGAIGAAYGWITGGYGYRYADPFNTGQPTTGPDPLEPLKAIQ